MSRIWLFFIEKRGLSYLILIALLVFGLGAVMTINRESSPEVQIPVAVISSVLPGASPEDVESLIVEELESAVANIDNIKNLTSTSREGVGVVTVEFEASADIDKSISKVKDEVDKVRGNLPDDATEPVVTEVNFSDQPIIMASIVSDLPITEFRTMADDLATQIEAISGVSRAEVSGVPDREVTVVVNKEDLILHNLTLQGVIGSIAASDVSTPVGLIQVDGVDYSIEFKGNLEDPSDVPNVPVVKSDGTVLRLSDIAFVTDGVADSSTISRVSTNGETPIQAATLLVYKQKGADVTRMSTNVNELIDTLNSDANATAQIVVTYDAGEQIINDLTQLVGTGLQTVGLVLFVLFMTLGWRAALIASLSIPLSFLTAISVMNVTGNTINFISLFSLILSIGILVDTAIVITEGIHTNFKKGHTSKKEAVRAAIRELHYPVTTGNLTTIAVFFPLFTISGVVGKFIASIPFTVIAVLVSSLIISLAFIPLLASRLLKATGESRMEKIQEERAERLRNWYKKRIPWLLDSRERKIRFFIVLNVVFFMLVSAPFVGAIKVTFFPQSDVDWIYVNLEEPQGTPLERTDLSIRPIEDILLEIPEIESFNTVIGSGSAFDDSPSSGTRFGSITINLAKDRERSSSEILDDIEAQLKQFNNLNAKVQQPSNGPPSGAPVLITFYGDDLDELKQLANQASDILRTIPGARNVTSSGEGDGSEFALTVDRERAAELGLTPATIAGTLRSAVYGTEATTIKKDGEEIRVVVKLNLNSDWKNAHDTNRATLDAIAELPVPTANGTVLLGSVLTSNIEASSDVIHREDEKRIATASSDLEDGFVASDVSAAFKDVYLSRMDIPSDIEVKVGGETEDTDQSFIDMFRALGMGIVLVFAVLVLQFNQFRQALIVLSVVPLSLIGVLLGLLITGEYLSFPSILGFIALAGIVVNNAIILVDVWNRMRVENPHMPLREVVIEGASLRLRPILLTTVTTIVGIAPLIFASDLWRPIAIAIMFGLLFAVVLTLMLVPILYLKFCKRMMDEDGIDDTEGVEPETAIGRKMEHIGDVLKDKFSVSPLMRSLLIVVFGALVVLLPALVSAAEYTQDNILTTYHEAPASFAISEYGEVTGVTVGGTTFLQRNIANNYGIRLQRFEIGSAYWYVSDRGVIWADTDLVALSIYLSRVA